MSIINNTTKTLNVGSGTSAIIFESLYIKGARDLTTKYTAKKAKFVSCDFSYSIAQYEKPKWSSVVEEIEFDNCTGYNNISFNGCSKLKSIKFLDKTAPAYPSLRPNVFGSNEQNYTGRDTYSTGENILYVPADSTGYDEGDWADVLCNPDKCGFTLSKTL